MDAQELPIRIDEPQLQQPVRRVAHLPCLRSEDLFTQGREVLIEHAGSYYRLRVTASNKLILMK